MDGSLTAAASPPDEPPPRVAVIVPCYRCTATIDRAIRSVDSQSQPPAELILVDDGSGDGTRTLLHAIAAQSRPYAIRVVELSDNRGPAAARNAGWEAISPTTSHVAFLDADDEWLPMKLAEQTRWMLRHPDIAWSAHLCRWSAQPQPTRCPVDTAASSRITRRGLLLRNFIATPAVIARREMSCRFRASWRNCEDLMLWLDWLDAGYPAALIHETWCVLGRRPTTVGGLTGDMAAMYAGERRVLDALVVERRMTAGEHWMWRLLAAARFRWRQLARLAT